MSLIKFELKDDHLKLLKHLNWSMIDEQITTGNDGTAEGDDLTEVITAFGGDDLIHDIGLIIYGQPEGFNPFNADGESHVYDDKELSYLRDLYDELPTAIELILYRQSFELGHFKTKYHNRDWKKYTPKK